MTDFAILISIWNKCWSLPSPGQVGTCSQQSGRLGKGGLPIPRQGSADRKAAGGPYLQPLGLEAGQGQEIWKAAVAAYHPPWLQLVRKTGFALTDEGKLEYHLGGELKYNHQNTLLLHDSSVASVSICQETPGTIWDGWLQSKSFASGCWSESQVF